MKQKDVALIIVLAGVSAIVSFLVSGWLFGKPAARQQEAEKVDVITSDFSLPDSRYFNTNSIDPTQLIQIGTQKIRTHSMVAHAKRRAILVI